MDLTKRRMSNPAGNVKCLDKAGREASGDGGGPRRGPRRGARGATNSSRSASGERCSRVISPKRGTRRPVDHRKDRIEPLEPGIVAWGATPGRQAGVTGGRGGPTIRCARFRQMLVGWAFGGRSPARARRAAHVPRMWVRATLTRPVGTRGTSALRLRDDHLPSSRAPSTASVLGLPVNSGQAAPAAAQARRSARTRSRAAAGAPTSASPWSAAPATGGTSRRTNRAPGTTARTAESRRA